MTLPLRNILKSPKFDAVVSFKKPDGSRTPRSITSSTSPSGGRNSSSSRTSPTGSRRDKTSRAVTRSQSRSPKNSNRGSPPKASSGGVTSSVVAHLADKGAARKNSYHVAFRNGDSANRAERLQVRLNALESEMSRLKLHEEQLEHRLKMFLRQKTALVNTIDDIHMKLDTLARSHKAISSNK